MRQALTLALQHTSTRRAFRGSIAEQPMMINVLADMAVEMEAAAPMALRLARATDHLETSEHERLLARVATPAAKYFSCSRVPAVVFEALQCHGGNGFVDENPMARLYREAPLNSVWEGTANMTCMGVRRAMLNDARTVDALLAELKPAAGQDRRFDALHAPCRAPDAKGQRRRLPRPPVDRGGGAGPAGGRTDPPQHARGRRSISRCAARPGRRLRPTLRDARSCPVRCRRTTSRPARRGRLKAGGAAGEISDERSRPLSA